MQAQDRAGCRRLVGWTDGGGRGRARADRRMDGWSILNSAPLGLSLRLKERTPRSIFTVYTTMSPFFLDTIENGYCDYYTTLGQKPDIVTILPVPDSKYHI